VRVRASIPGGGARNGVPVGGYRRFGDPDWTPESLGPMEKGNGGNADAQQRARAAGGAS
jgi:hypothetical protein